MKARNKKNRQFQKKLISFLILFGLVLVLSLKMYQSFQVDLLMKDLHILEQEKKQLISDTEKLRSEVERLKNIDRISKIAFEKFGLISNTDEIVIVQISDYQMLKSLKKEFAKRNQENKSYNLAGVH